MKCKVISLDDLFTVDMFRPGYTNKNVSKQYLEGVKAVIRHILSIAYTEEHEEVRYRGKN